MSKDCRCESELGCNGIDCNKINYKKPKPCAMESINFCIFIGMSIMFILSLAFMCIYKEKK